MKNQEKGITLMTLVIMVVIIIILASIGITSGTSAIKSSQYMQFKNELKIIQTKVNELNQENNIEIGITLNNKEKNLLNKSEIFNIIYDGRTDEEKQKIQDGFRYCNQDTFKNKLNLDSIKRDYLINIEYCYVIYYYGYEYKGEIIYMADQIKDSIYNVSYKEEKDISGSFEVQYVREGNKWKIQIDNINYNKKIDNWQIRYKHIDDEKWKETNNLNFYVTKTGKYLVEVKHGDNVNLGIQELEIEEDFVLNRFYMNNSIINII